MGEGSKDWGMKIGRVSGLELGLGIRVEWVGMEFGLGLGLVMDLTIPFISER